MAENTNRHFWDEEYYNGSDPDTECIRIMYQKRPFHIVMIMESTYIVTDDVTSCLHLDERRSLQYLQLIPESCKAVRSLKRSNGTEYQVALLSEDGLCKLIGLVKKPEAFKFLHDIQGVIKRINAPATGIYARVAEQFAIARRKRQEASQEVPDLGIQQAVLSNPSYLKRNLLSKVNMKIASVLTLDARSSLTVYKVSGQYWFEAKCILKLLGYSRVASSESIFRDVPPCWLADVEDSESGNISMYIQLAGVLFYLCPSTNINLIYLMQYLSHKIYLLDSKDSTPSNLVTPLVTPFKITPYSTEVVTPSYTEQLNGMQTILMAMESGDLSESSLAVLDYMAVYATGVSPLAVIKQWKQNTNQD